ncbi:MAG: hypothetical protein WDZ69_02025 [Candidatus Pacearchaeota archaeon]
MAQKKRAKKTSKKSVKKSSKSVAKKVSSNKVNSISRKLGVAWKNLILFLILFVASFVLYSASTSDLFISFFWVLSFITGFIFLAFLIAFIVLLIVGYSKSGNRNKAGGKPKAKKTRKRKK